MGLGARLLLLVQVLELVVHEALALDEGHGRGRLGGAAEGRDTRGGAAESLDVTAIPIGES